MNKIKKVFTVLSILLTTLIVGCSGKEAETKVKYFVDGAEKETAPDKNYYEAVDIKSNGKDATIVWDCATWSLSASNIEGTVNVEVYFEYQTKPVTVDGIGFESLQDAFNYAGTTPKTIYITRDINDSGNTAVGSDIELELGGFTIDGQGKDTVINNGKMTVLGNGTITNTVDNEYSKSIVNYGDLTLQGVTVTNSTNSVCIWNSENGQSNLIVKDSNISHSLASVMTVVNSGNMEIVSGSITGCGDSFHPTLYNNRNGSVLTLTGGEIQNTADGYSIYNESGVINLGATTYGDSYNMPSAE